MVQDISAATLPLHILVADDNSINQMLIKRVIERLGYQIDQVRNGLEVLEALKKKTYDLILMDVQMPEMNGLEAAKQIIATYPEAQRPLILAITANSMEDDTQKCLEAGMQDSIEKPFKIEELKAILYKWKDRLLSKKP